jgi:hypothetical protein
MATSNIEFNAGLRHGSLLRSALTSLENGHDALNDVIASMQLMIDGDGSNVSHFNEMMTRFGFASTTTAKAAWDELNSVRFKLNTNDSVSDVLAALNQAFAKFR